MVSLIHSLTLSLIYPKIAYQVPALFYSPAGILVADKMSMVVSRNLPTNLLENVKMLIGSVTLVSNSF